MPPYVVDFYCPAAKLVVEVDGEFHADRYARDSERQAVLESRGYRVVRVSAVDVMTDLDSVVEALFLNVPPSGP
jgi:very-short-patch-repair endonuclease